MKRNVLSIFLFNIFIVLAVLITALYASMKYDVATSAPYGMRTGTISFYAFSPYADKATADRALKQIRSLCESESLRLVFCGDNAYGEGVFDSSGHMSPALSGDGMQMLVKKGSYLERVIGEKKTYDSPMGTLEVIGFYDEACALSAAEYDYIYPFLASSNLDGLYTIDAENPQISQRLVSIFIKNGYELSNQTKYQPMGFLEFMANMRGDTFFYAMLLSLLFIYGNYALFVFVLQQNLARAFWIRRLLGATRSNLLRTLARAYLGSILLGSLAGCLVCTAQYASLQVHYFRAIQIGAAVHVSVAFTLTVIACLAWNAGHASPEVRQ